MKGVFTMKKFITFVLAATLTLTAATPALAVSIPRESAPANATEEAIQITENIIGGILDEVENGTAEYSIGRANALVRKAVIAGETNGYGYGVMSAIVRNAIRTMRDMQLRPELYQSETERLKVLLADIITEVENGADYTEARDKAYIRIYQSADPTFNPDEQFSIDTCYRDMPAVDMATFTVARKLLIEAQNAYLQQ